MKLGNSNIRVTKWVKYIEEGQEGDEADQVTEEQLTASVTGAESFLQPAAGTGLVTAATSVPTSTVNTPASTGPLLAQPVTASAAAPSALSQSMTMQEPSIQDIQAVSTIDGSLAVDSVTGNASIIAEGSTTATDPSIAPAIESSQAHSGAAAAAAVDSSTGVPEASTTILTDTTSSALPPLQASEPGQQSNTLNPVENQMEVEAEQREVDTLLAPELIGKEAESTRAALGERYKTLRRAAVRAAAVIHELY